MTTAELPQPVQDFGTYPCQLSADVCKDILPETCISLLLACITPNTLVTRPCPYYSTRHSKLSLENTRPRTRESSTRLQPTISRCCCVVARAPTSCRNSCRLPLISAGYVSYRILCCAREPASWKAVWKEQTAVAAGCLSEEVDPTSWIRDLSCFLLLSVAAVMLCRRLRGTDKRPSHKYYAICVISAKYRGVVVVLCATRVERRAGVLLLRGSRTLGVR